MKRLDDTSYRKTLIERYLDAETTPEEEKELRDFYLWSNPGTALTEDEKDFQALLGMSADGSPEYEISRSKADEFDRIMAKRRVSTNIRRTVRWISSAAAVILIASGTVFLTKYKSGKETSIAGNTAPDYVITEFGNCSDLSEVVDMIFDDMAQSDMKESGNSGISEISSSSVMGIIESALADSEIETYDMKAVGGAALITLAYKNGGQDSYIASGSEDALSLIPIGNPTKRKTL